MATVHTQTDFAKGVMPDAGSSYDMGDASPGKIAVAIVIARTVEFFDFFVYAIASVLVFPTLFFNAPDPVTGMLYSFAVFSVAFLARPLGSLLFNEIGRSFGRGVKLTAALLMLGGSTIAVSFLPTYAQIGVLSTALLAVFRFGQGLGLGGAWDGLVSLLALNAPDNRRGWFAVFPQIGFTIGFCLASGLFLFLLTSLSREDFLEWGWRFPFFVALALNVVALFARLRLTVTPDFTRLLERHELQPQPLSRLFRVNAREVIIGAFIPLASFALFHIVTVFALGWTALYTGYDTTRFLALQLIGAAIAGGAMFLSGLIADKIGRRTLLAITAVLIGIFSLFITSLLGGNETGLFLFVFIGFGLLGLSFGQAGGAIAARFSRELRYTGASFTTDIAWLVGAAFAPLVALGLASRYGLAFSGYYLLSGSVCTLIALAVTRKLETTNE